ncbi:Type IV pilus assembly ATPase PilB [Gammaproteobacteria bacterium]
MFLQRVTATKTKPEKIRLGDILVQQNLITVEQLRSSLDEQQRSGRRLGRLFVERGYLTEEQIAQALARQLKIPYINIKYYQLTSQQVQRLPETQARRWRVLVLEDRNNRVLVGMADPTDLFAYDEISRLLRCDIDLAVVSEDQLLQAIDRFYRRTDEIKGLAQELTAEIGDSSIDFGIGGVQGGDEAPVARLLQTIFEDASQVHASDVHIEPQEAKLQIRFRIDGVLHLQTETDTRIAQALVLRLKLVSGLDISEKRLPQDGRFNVRIGGQMIDVRVSTLPTQYGESVVMRLLNQQMGLLKLERLGMPPLLLQRFRQAMQHASGMVLVTGPTGSGKTTTLYAALSEINSIANKVITVEDPVEYRLPGINQVQVNDKIELTFSRVLRSALRQDPDIILVGEVRDQETAEIALRAALTGHLVLSTLHTNDAATTPVRLLDMNIPAFMIASSLRVVLAQRLLRLVCETCAEPYTLKSYEEEWLRYGMGKQTVEPRYVQGRGCSHCNGTGYRGRIGIYELLEMTPALVEAVTRQDVHQFVARAGQQLAGQTLRHRAVELVMQGRAMVTDAMRLSNDMGDIT